MQIAFTLTATVLVLGMAAAMALRNVVRCVLALTVGFFALAALYLELGAQFVGFAQVLVYIGAVAILVVFVIMMTHSQSAFTGRAPAEWLPGAAIAAAVFAMLAWCVLHGRVLSGSFATPQPTVAGIGQTLVRSYVLPLEITALLLTAAMLGAVVLALNAKQERASQ